jgi:hypothetical protein
MHVREFMTAPAVTLIRLVAMAVPGRHPSEIR